MMNPSIFWCLVSQALGYLRIWNQPAQGLELWNWWNLSITTLILKSSHKCTMYIIWSYLQQGIIIIILFIVNLVLYFFMKLIWFRFAKRKLDAREYYGSILHVCYAPELESVEETRAKLTQRRKEVHFKLKNLKQTLQGESSTWFLWRQPRREIGKWKLLQFTFPEWNIWTKVDVKVIYIS